jgi:hypothetical protein
MTARFTLFGFPLPERAVRAVEDGVTVMQDDGEPVTRWRTSDIVPVPLPVPHDYSGAA